LECKNITGKILNCLSNYSGTFCQQSGVFDRYQWMEDIDDVWNASREEGEKI
jgi:hypothetical protein